MLGTIQSFPRGNSLKQVCETGYFALSEACWSSSSSVYNFWLIPGSWACLNQRRAALSRRRVPEFGRMCRYHAPAQGSVTDDRQPPAMSTVCFTAMPRVVSTIVARISNFLKNLPHHKSLDPRIFHLRHEPTEGAELCNTHGKRPESQDQVDGRVSRA